MWTQWIALSLLWVSVNGFYYIPPNAGDQWKSSEMKQRCPKVKAMRHFDLPSILGSWYVMQYYASSEEMSEYSCMRSVFSMNDEHVTMFFTYRFEDDPQQEQQQGNITWTIPSYSMPSHWVHTEDIYEGIYNTYIIDTDSKAWALIMHCAEKSRSPRYLSALLLSREKSLGTNVVNFLREKLPRYDIDLTQMFAIRQDECDQRAAPTGGVDPQPPIVEIVSPPEIAGDVRFVIPKEETLSAEKIDNEFY